MQPQHITFLQELLSDTKNATLTLKEMKSKLLDIYPELQNLTLQTLSNELSKNQFSFKNLAMCPERQNSEIVKNERKRLVQKLVYSLYKEYDVIFVDETSLHFGEKRRYGWGKKGAKISIIKQPKSKNYSLLTAISDREILGCQFIRGGVKKEDFVGFICSLFKQKNLGINNSHLIIFLDNASCHKAKHVKKYLGSKIKFLFNAGYSPMLNPIEEFFSKLKMMIRKLPTSNETELVCSTQLALTKFRTKDFQGYIRHTLSFVEDCMLKLDLD